MYKKLGIENRKSEKHATKVKQIKLKLLISCLSFTACHLLTYIGIKTCLGTHRKKQTTY
jgi:hypothetical protein